MKTKTVASATERMGKYQVLLAESHPLCRQVIVEVLERMPRVNLVAEVAHGCDVMLTSVELKPDIILLDFSLPGLSALEITSSIKAELPQIQVVILLDEEDERYLRAVAQSGAWAHLVKVQLAQKLPSLLDKLEWTERRSKGSNYMISLRN